jgi:hypothetical protein
MRARGLCLRREARGAAPRGYGDAYAGGEADWDSWAREVGRGSWRGRGGPGEHYGGVGFVGMGLRRLYGGGESSVDRGILRRAITGK